MSPQDIFYLGASEVLKAYNVPTGLQLVAATFQDKSVFQSGMALESARGRWYHDPANRPCINRID